MLRRIILRMLEMNDRAWYIFKGSLQLSVVMLFGAVMLLIDNGSREIYLTAQALFELVPVVLLIAVLGSVCIEDMGS